MPEIQHEDLTSIHPAGYVQSGDPGAVGANKVWFDTSTSPYLIKVRNALDSGWVTIFNPAVYALLASPAFSGNPTTPNQSAGNNSTRIANTAYVDAAISVLIGTAPGVLDTLGEISDAINDDANLYTTLVTAIAAAVNDTVYGAGWNGDTTHAPSKNAVYDKIEALAATIGAVSDTAFGGGWNGDTTTAASKNALYDYLITLASLTGAETITSKKFSLTAAHGSDDTYEGQQIPGLNNSGGVTQWDAVYLNSSSQWVLADANGSGTYPARGLAVSTETTGNPVTVLIRGTVRNDAWSWTVGGTIYLSGTAGGLTQTQPSTSGDKVQAVGYALTADIAFFDFDSFYFTVA